MKFRYVIPAMAAVVALALTGCSNDDAAVKEDAPTSIMSIDDIREAGVLVVATDAEYPPNEFKDEEGNPTGWAVELTEALAAEMGLEVEWQIMGFDAILPRIEEGVVNVGSSSFTDNKERQEVVDFVDYLNAGSQWAAAKGSDVDPDNACGLTVAVQTGTIQVQELQERSEQCEGEGNDPIDIFEQDTQGQVNTAVVQGQAEAFTADLPVAVDAVDATDGALELVGEMFDAAPYGFAVQKDSGVAEAVQEALQALIDDGTYLDILTRAGFENGALTEATINAG